MPNDDKFTLCLDFDGVIHSYTSDWVDARTIPDPVTPGFFDWALRAQEHFKLVIYSSRSKEPGAIDAMRKWLEKEYARSDPAEFGIAMPTFIFAHEKPKAFVTIDDRVEKFDGRWDVPELSPETLLEYKPWNKR